MRIPWLLFTAILLLPSALAQQTVRVAAAADLQPVLQTLAALYQQQSGVQIVASYASSSTLAMQILNGAPMDLFLSADFSFAQKVIDGACAEDTAPIRYATGTLVFWARNDSQLLAGKPITLDLLRSPALHHLAIANPDHAPYGRAAMAALTSLNLADALRPKLVIAENIAQTAQFADTGNADAALISLTLVSSPELSAHGSYIAMPAGSYPPILQGAVVIKNSDNTKAARDFLNYLLTPTIQSKMAQMGLTQ
jgi:molybdate transport system substrate-binding protein